jgi:hypothetical protein
MTPESVLTHAPLVLDQQSRARYFQDGFLTVPGYVGAGWLDRLRVVVAAKIEESDGGEPVRWHQDIQAWPHTNFAVLTFGVYLDDTGPEQGPLTAIPGTHRGKIFDQFDDDGRWTGAVTARDAATLPTEAAVDLCGPAGTVVLLDCRVVHGSAANYSSRMRPLFLNVYAAADALPFTPMPAPTSKTGLLVRGHEPDHVHIEPYPAKLPPRWDRVGYRSIFAAQSAYADSPTWGAPDAPHARDWRRSPRTAGPQPRDVLRLAHWRLGTPRQSRGAPRQTRADS